MISIKRSSEDGMGARQGALSDGSHNNTERKWQKTGNVISMEMGAIDGNRFALGVHYYCTAFNARKQWPIVRFFALVGLKV